MDIGFYLVGRKGYCVLKDYIERHGVASVAYVVSAKDAGLSYDWYDEIKAFSEKNQLKFATNEESYRDSSLSAGYRFAVGWKWILHDSRNLIVFHDSLLPKYRGFSPLVNMLIDGEQQIGVTALKATKDYDRGPIISQRSVHIKYPKKIYDAIEDLIPLYCQLVSEIASEVCSGRSLQSVEQSEVHASYSLWRGDDDYFINWQSDSESIERFIDAVGHPYRGAAVRVDQRVVRILGARAISDVMIENRLAHVGKVVFMRNGRPIVVCGNGLIEITDLRTGDGLERIHKVNFRTRFEGRDGK